MSQPIEIASGVTVIRALNITTIIIIIIIHTIIMIAWERSKIH